MFKLSSFLVLVCVFLLSCGLCADEVSNAPSDGVKEDSDMHEGDHVHDDQPYDQDATDVKINPDAQLLPEVPYPTTIEEENVKPAPLTPTVDNVVIVGAAAGGAAAVVSLPKDEDLMSTVDYTDESVDNTADDIRADGLPETVPPTKDVPQASEENGEAIEVTGDSQSKAPAATGGGDSTVAAEGDEQVKDTEDERLEHMPEPTQTADNFRVWSQEPDFGNIDSQHPSTQMDLSTTEPWQATEALKSISPGTHEVPTRLPEGVGGMAVESPFARDSGSESEGDVGEDGKKKGEEEEFPTFDKWSVQYLAEQEKQKIEKAEQVQASNPGPAVGQKKLRQNFAAASCGAKVVASNVEAENINYLLNGNPDEYMLNPCKAKKWFVVELCEPLQIHKVELGTLELFSSQPKSFRVFASQRYPTKEWAQMGKFDMTLERSVQSFHTQVSEEFVKFVRVDMLEHHGDEHYCPITTFRVLGIDMASDEDDEHDHDPVETEGQDLVDEDGEEIEGSVNLFTSAKDTVVKLVKKVLYKGDQEATQPEGGDTAPEGHAQSDNATAKSEDQKGDSGEAAPCPDKGLRGGKDGPTTEIPPAGVIPPPLAKEPEEVPIITKLADTEQLPMDTTETPIVVKLDQEVDPFAREQYSPSLCYHNPWASYAWVMSLRLPSVSFCGAEAFTVIESSKDPSAEIRTEVLEEEDFKPTDAVHPGSTEASHGDLTATEEPTDQAETAAPTQDKVASTSEKTDPKGSAADDQKVPDTAKKDKPVDIKPQKSSSVESKEAKTPPEKIQTRQDQQRPKPDESVASSQSTTFSADDVSATKSETLEPSSLSTQAELDKEAVSVTTPGLDIQQSQVVEQGATDLAETIFLKVSPSPTHNSEDPEEVGSTVVPDTPTALDEREDEKLQDISQAPKEAENGQPASGTPNVEPENGEAVANEEGKADGSAASTAKLSVDQAKPQVDNVNKTKVKSSPTASKTGRPDLVKVGLSSNAKRDNSLMKLNNRILALEQNVSMTKKYLEELSRAFKQQNEEMMKLLNKTEKKLTVYIVQAEERDLRRQARIDVLEQKVANLTKVIDVMQVHMDTMAKELRDGQILLVFVQIVLFVWLVISSYRRRTKSSLAYSDIQFLLDTMPRQPYLPLTEKGRGPRRNSDIGVNIGMERRNTIKRQSSETNLASSLGGYADPVDTSSLFKRRPSQVSKKKKKKKLRQSQALGDNSLPISTVSTAITTDVIPIQTASFSSSAGVLFGTSSDQQHNGDKVVGSLSRKNSLQLAEEDLKLMEKDRAFWKSWFWNEASSIPEQSAVHSGSSSSTQFGCKGVSDGKILASKSSDVKCPEPVTKHPLGCITELMLNQQAGGVNAAPFTPTRSLFVQTASDSPEFQMPAYHRNKIRRLGDSSSSSTSGAILKSFSRQHSFPDEPKRRKSWDRRGPGLEGKYFMAEDYLLENRFKFPATPVRSATSSKERQDNSWHWNGWDKNATSDSISGQVDVNDPPKGSNVQNVQPSSPLSACALHSSISSPSSSWSTVSSTSASLSSTSHPRTPPATPSFIMLDQGTSRKSFTSSLPPRPQPPPRPPPPSHTSSRPSHGVLTDHGHKNHHQHHVHISDTVHTVLCKPAPKHGVHSGAASKTAGGNSHSSGSGGNKKSSNGHQTHRRQGSYPLIQNRKSRSMEKEGRPTRQGSLEGPKLLSKASSSGNSQGSKVKKAASNPSFLARKGSVSKQGAFDGTSTQSGNKKGP